MPVVESVYSVTDLTSLQVEGIILSLGEPSYRAKQLESHVYRKLASSFDEMTDLPLQLRQELSNWLHLHSLTPLHEVKGADGTFKTLFSLVDGRTVESVLMSYPATGSKPRYTVCLSTQVGCPVGCPFCATGQQGFERNLRPGEIIDQVLYFARYLKEREPATGNLSGTISNIVFMGMGEPLANYNALWQAIETLNSSRGFGLGARSMTISTSGLVPQIKRLAGENLQVGLAISLHASDNALRDRLVPINRKYPLEQLLPACREYVETTGRRLSFEYILFEGINDSLSQAGSLARLLTGINCHVNLIPANRTDSTVFKPPKKSRVLAFLHELERQHITATIRQGKGLDINSGCGQLRSRFLERPV